jgi:hypothetical protein
MHFPLLRAAGRLLATLLIVAHAAAADTLHRGIFHIAHAPEHAETAAFSADVLEEAAAEFAPRLPAGGTPIRVVIAADQDEFQAYARTFQHVEVSGVARASENLIVVKAPGLRRPGDDFRGTLRHELVHILLDRNVDTDRLPRWLNEGLCMMLANEYHWESILQLARMFARNAIIPYPELDRTFRAPGDEMAFGDAYAQGLSMTRHLRDTLGEEVFWQVVLATRDQFFADALRDVAGTTVLEFWHDYESGLWRIAMIGTLVSGSLLGPAGFLVIIAWFRQRWRNRRTLNRWEREEAAAAGDPAVFSWDDVADDPDAWKAGTEYEEDDDGARP